MAKFKAHFDDGSSIEFEAKHVHIFDTAALFHDDEKAGALESGDTDNIRALVPFDCCFLIEKLEGDKECK